MSKLDNKLRLIYNNINYYTIAEQLSEQYRFEDRLENYSVEVVVEIIQSYGYQVKFMKKESFFKILEKCENYVFYFHLSLKYGLVEVIFGVTDKDKKHLAGGAISTITKLMEIDRGIEKDGYMKYPSFRDYADLNDILRSYFRLYENFKQEVLKTL